MRRSFYPEREIARYIILAQSASDAGKGSKFRYIPDSRGAFHFGYGVKTSYILAAIRLIRACNQNMFRYYVTGNTPDQNGNASVIVYFDVKLEGKRRQISFHTPWNQVEGTILERLIGSGRKTRWDRNIGGSSDTCYDLAEYFHLR
jgi:hypothetical protein